MKEKLSAVDIILTSLALLYAVSCLTYAYMLSIPDFAIQSSILCLCFFILFIGGYAARGRREWGRRWVIAGSLFLSVYTLALYPLFADIVPISYVLLSIVVILFLSQKKIRAEYQIKKKDRWKCILIVDDDDSSIKTVRPILIAHGYSVLTAQTGELGLQVAREHHPDLILLDVILPGIKGREVCHRLKEDSRTKNIPVVFLTAKDSPDDIQAEKEVGAATHLTKPVSTKLLISTVKDILSA